MPVGVPGEIGQHTLVADRLVHGVVEIESGQHILAAVAKLFGHVIVPVPHGGFLQRGGDGLFGRHRRGGHGGCSQSQRGGEGHQAGKRAFRKGHEGALVL
jgi:hypothetical protein